MNTTVKKPGSILKSMKAFWIYEVILIIFFLLMFYVSEIDFGWGMFYYFYIYIGGLLIAAPILFGIWFGYHIGKKQNVSSGKKKLIGILMFFLNYCTYWIPLCFMNREKSSSSWIVTLLPALGLTVIFLIASIITSAVCRHGHP